MITWAQVIAHIIANPWRFASVAEAAEDLRRAGHVRRDG